MPRAQSWLSKESSIVFLVIFGILVRLLLAYELPLSSDESYYFLWAKHLDYGYYDHPALLAWMLYPFQIFGSPFGFRLAAVISYSGLIPFLGYQLFRLSEQRVRVLNAFWVLTCLPLGYLPFINHELPQLILLLGTSVAYLNWVKSPSLRSAGVTGLLAGLTLLTKTTSVAFILGLFLCLIFERTWITRQQFVIFLFGFVPSFAITLTWNFLNCFSQIEFQLLRSSFDHTFQIYRHIGVTLLYFVVCIGPLAWLIPKATHDLRKSQISRFLTVQFFCLFLMGVGLSIKIHYSIHYLFPCVVFLALLIVNHAPTTQLRKLSFSGAIVMSLIFGVGSWMVNHHSFTQNGTSTLKWYTLSGQSVLRKNIQELPAEFEVAALNYDEAALGEVVSGRRVWVLGNATHRGRSYDWWDDLRHLKGKPVAIFTLEKRSKESLRSFFEKSEYSQPKTDPYPFEFLYGYSFNYETYRSQFLEPILRQYYDLPLLKFCHSCPVVEKYR